MSTLHGTIALMVGDGSRVLLAPQLKCESYPERSYYSTAQNTPLYAQVMQYLFVTHKQN